MNAPRALRFRATAGPPALPVPTDSNGARPPSLPAWKRGLDLAGAACALPLLGVLLLGMAALIRLSSPGPVFFRQQRIGYRGQPFTLLKFRTMHVGAPSLAHDRHVSDLVRSRRPMCKLDGSRDARVIPGAWLLRASGLDELPQIINVLRGEMSLVGPRPCVPYEYEHYTAAQRRRFDAVPGLTGLWQVSGKNSTTFETMVRLDLDYLTRCSLLLDLRIIALTVPVLLAQILATRRQRRQARSAPPPGDAPAVPTAPPPDPSATLLRPPPPSLSPAASSPPSLPSS